MANKQLKAEITLLRGQLRTVNEELNTLKETNQVFRNLHSIPDQDKINFCDVS